jgi:hypothetical protein
MIPAMVYGQQRYSSINSSDISGAKTGVSQVL